MKSKIVFLLAALTIQLNAQEITGDWSGVLSYQGMEIRIVFHVTSENGTYRSTMDSPDQGATGIAMDQTNFEAGKLSIEASALEMKYTAELKENGETLDGTFVQQGISIPLELKKEKEESQTSVRPQDPTDFIVLLEGPGIEIKELLLMQQDKTAEANGVSDEIRSKMVKLASNEFDYIDENIHLERDQLPLGMAQYLEGQIEDFT